MVELLVCRSRCLAYACPHRTFSDHAPSIAAPFARRTSSVGQIVNHPGMRHAGGLPRASCTDWALRSATPRCFCTSSAVYETVPSHQRLSALMIGTGECRRITEPSSSFSNGAPLWISWRTATSKIARNGCASIPSLKSSAGTVVARMQKLPTKECRRRYKSPTSSIFCRICAEQMNMHGRVTGRALLSDADNISTTYSCSGHPPGRNAPQHHPDR